MNAAKPDASASLAETVTLFVQPGDVWTLGRHRMVCGDATNADHVALLMDGVKANLVVTDPPYNVAYESADGKSILNDSMADGKFYEFLYQGAIEHDPSPIIRLLAAESPKVRALVKRQHRAAENLFHLFTQILRRVHAYRRLFQIL